MTLFFPFWIFVFILIIFCVCCAPVWQRGRVLAVGWTFQKRSHPVNPQSIGIGTSHTHTPLHLPSGHSSVLSSFFALHLSIYPSIDRCSPFNQTWLNEPATTPEVETVWTRLKEPLHPSWKKKVLKFLILTKYSPMKANIVHSMSRRSTAKWNRETT